MITTIDRSGRLVLPKQLRDEIGLVPGEVEVYTDGATIRVEPIFRIDVQLVDGYLMLPDADHVVTSEEIRELRLADQR